MSVQSHGQCAAHESPTPSVLDLVELSSPLDTDFSLGSLSNGEEDGPESEPSTTRTTSHANTMPASSISFNPAHRPLAEASKADQFVSVGSQSQQTFVAISLSIILISSASFIALSSSRIRCRFRKWSMPSAPLGNSSTWHIFSWSQRRKDRKHKDRLEKIKTMRATVNATLAEANKSVEEPVETDGVAEKLKSRGSSGHRSPSPTPVPSPSPGSFFPSRRHRQSQASVSSVTLLVPGQAGAPAVAVTTTKRRSTSGGQSEVETEPENHFSDEGSRGRKGKGRKHASNTSKRSTLMETPSSGDKPRPPTRDCGTQVEEDFVLTRIDEQDVRDNKMMDQKEIAVQTATPPLPPGSRSTTLRMPLSLDTSDEIIRTPQSEPSTTAMGESAHKKWPSERAHSIAASSHSMTSSIAASVESNGDPVLSVSYDPVLDSPTRLRSLRNLDITDHAKDRMNDDCQNLAISARPPRDPSRDLGSFPAAQAGPSSSYPASSSSSQGPNGAEASSSSASTSSRRDSVSTAATSETSWLASVGAAGPRKVTGSENKKQPTPCLGKKPSTIPRPSLGGSSTTTAPGRVVPGLDRRPSATTLTVSDGVKRQPSSSSTRSRSRRNKGKGKANGEADSQDAGTTEDVFWMDSVATAEEEAATPEKPAFTRSDTVISPHAEESRGLQMERLRRWSEAAVSAQDDSASVPASHQQLRPSPAYLSRSSSPAAMPNPQSYLVMPTYPSGNYQAGSPYPGYSGAYPGYTAMTPSHQTSPYAMSQFAERPAMSRRGSTFLAPPGQNSPLASPRPSFDNHAVYAPAPQQTVSQPFLSPNWGMNMHVHPSSACDPTSIGNAGGYFGYAAAAYAGMSLPMSRSGSPNPRSPMLGQPSVPTPDTVPRSSSAGGRPNDYNKMKDALAQMKAAVKKMETQKERMRKELEFTKWSLRCREQDDVEAQTSIAHFAQRAERAEARIKSMEESRAQEAKATMVASELTSSPVDESSALPFSDRFPLALEPSPHSSDSERHPPRNSYDHLPSRYNPSSTLPYNPTPSPSSTLESKKPTKPSRKSRRSLRRTETATIDDESDWEVEVILGIGETDAQIQHQSRQGIFSGPPSRKTSRCETDPDGLGTWNTPFSPSVQSMGGTEEDSLVPVALLSGSHIVGSLPAHLYHPQRFDSESNVGQDHDREATGAQEGDNDEGDDDCHADEQEDQLFSPMSATFPNDECLPFSAEPSILPQS